MLMGEKNIFPPPITFGLLIRLYLYTNHIVISRMKEDELNDLLDRYLKGECTSEEAKMVNSYFNEMAKSTPSPGTVTDLQALQDRVWTKMGIRHKPAAYIPFARYAAVITVILGLSLGYYQYIYHTNHHTSTKTINDIPPGGNKAILTLANGKQISLNSQNGALSNGSIPGVQISNDTTSGIVTFTFKHGQAESQSKAVAASINTISTPPGGKYQLILSDGTRVVLNAASKITFPSRFTGSRREVFIIGEVYFEVTKDPSHPFLVNTQQQQLTVLGTHFNVSAYPDQTVKTTLAEGSVLLLQPSIGLRQPLKPDQQAELLSTGFNVKHVITSDEIAWIDGMFIFKQTPLKEAMQQICRWYNVEVDFNNLPNKLLDADLSRTLTLSEVLKGLEFSSDVKFTLEGRRLVFNK